MWVCSVCICYIYKAHLYKSGRLKKYMWCQNLQINVFLEAIIITFQPLFIFFSYFTLASLSVLQHFRVQFLVAKPYGVMRSSFDWVEATCIVSSILMESCP